MGIEPEGFDQFGAWGIERHGLRCSDGCRDFFVIGFRPAFGSRGGCWQLGVLDEAFCQSVIFWMDDGAIESVSALVDPKKTDGLSSTTLGEGLLEKFRECVTIVEISLGAFLDEPFCRGVVHSGDPFEDFDVGMVHVDAGFGDRRGDGFLKCGLEFGLG